MQCRECPVSCLIPNQRSAGITNGVEERDGLSIPCQKRPIRRPRVMCSC